ncbi:MAG TPA: single-stranded-DNA-specific exonuclease RecJ [Ruminococcaceae bacterium]|nr:single-stranded-DNA-specific exonuclease RecJ [Oscillospiraceae bacterium]
MVCREWTVAEYDKEIAKQYAKELDLDAFISLILVARGFGDPTEIEEFLSADESIMGDPSELPDMSLAVNRIRQAIDRFEQIAIYGDYDVDGITSTAMLYSYLSEKQANVQYYIPRRDADGYGMNKNSLALLHERGARLIITVDNGISAHDEIEYAKSLGMDVIVTDHHLPGQSLPDAQAVIDPHREDCGCEFKNLAGVGVAFKLICALESDRPVKELIKSYGEFLALGTVADVMPLINENRLFVKMGLESIEKSGRPGIAALLGAAGLEGKKITAFNIAYGLAPRINASGRMGKAERAVRLLLEKDPQKAAELALEFNAENAERQSAEAEIVKQAIASIEAEPSLKYARVLVVSGEGWHHGVIGIAASRLSEYYGKPAIVISTDGESDAVGSGRSIRGFSLYDAIAESREMLTRFGGHELAAGLTVPPGNIEHLRRRVNDFAYRNYPEMPVMRIKLDCRLNPKGLSVDTALALSALEPFGSGNPAPVFGLFGLQLKEVTPVGGGKHLRLGFSKDGTDIQIMCFSRGREDFPYSAGETLDAAVTLAAGEYKGRPQLGIYAKDFRYSESHQRDMISGFRLYESFLRGELMEKDAAAKILPDRGEIAEVYKYLRQNRAYIHLAAFTYRLKMPYAKLRIIIDVLEEMGLISFKIQKDRLVAEVLPAAEKVKLEDSEILSRLKNRENEVSA